MNVGNTLGGQPRLFCPRPPARRIVVSQKRWLIVGHVAMHPGKMHLKNVL
jgi:hypothetical protein